MTQEALKLALEALEQWNTPLYKRGTAITAIKEALAQPEPVSYTGNGTAGREADVRPTGFFFQMPKSVGEVYGWHGAGKGQPMCRFNASEAEMPVGTKLYTTPPQRTWVGLTDEEMLEAIKPLYANPFLAHNALEVSRDEYQAIEAKLKEKNNG